MVPATYVYIYIYIRGAADQAGRAGEPGQVAGAGLGGWPGPDGWVAGWPGGQA